MYVSVKRIDTSTELFQPDQLLYLPGVRLTGGRFLKPAKPAKPAVKCGFATPAAGRMRPAEILLAELPKRLFLHPNKNYYNERNA
jgi:hypothetical protein